MPRNRPLTIECLETRRLLAVSGVLWHDLDGDGIRSAAEPGLVGAEVRLLEGSGALAASAQTGPDGAYSFPDVAPGTFRVELKADNFQPGHVLEGFQFSEQATGSNPDLDSDFTPSTRQSKVVTVAAGTAGVSLDGGLYVPATIGGVKFQDANGDGYRAEDEPRQDDWPVQLRTPPVQSVVSSGDRLARPIDVAIEDDGSLIVVNRNSKYVLRVDPETGQQQSLSFGGSHLLVPVGVAVKADGNLLVIDLGTKKVVSIDSQTGGASVVTSGGEITRPTGIAVEADGNILVTNSETKTLLRILPDTGEQQVLSQGGKMQWPTAVDVGDDGQIFVADWRGKVIRIDPATGAQQIVAEGSDLEEASGIVVAPDGQLVVVGQKARKLLRIDPVTGSQLVVAEQGEFIEPSGIAIDSSGRLIVADQTALGVGAILGVTARQVLAEVMPSSGGEFIFSDLAPGSYELHAPPRNNWTPTSQNPVIVEVNSGEHEDRDLGSFATVSLTGTKFHDLNANGIKDAGEPGQAGWTVFLDYNRNGAPSLNEPSTVTAEDGSFTFEDIPAGTHHVLTRQQNGWQPSHAPLSIEVHSSIDITGVDLGSTFGEPMGEVGVVEGLTQLVRTVVFQHEYDNPVVVAMSPSASGDDPVVVRITDVQSDRFSLYLQPAPGSGGESNSETVSYAVLEAGLWELPDGAKLEVGTLDTSTTAGQVLADSWPAIAFASPFTANPVVLSQVQSSNDASYVSTRLTDLSPRQVRVALEEEEASTQSHGRETIGWIAIEPGAGSWNEEANFLAIDAQGGLLQAARQKPNVVLITLDDLNDWVGALGGYAGTVHTPNLDKLFSRAAGFTNAHVPAPKCNPSRTSVMTGLHPATTGIVENDLEWLDVIPDAVTLPAYFRQNGFTTAGYGKVFHLPVPTDGDPMAWDVTASYGPAYAASSVDGIERTLGFPIGAVDADASEFRDGRTVASALEFLASAPRDPFFLSMGLFHPHAPWLAPREYFDLYPLDEIVLPELAADELDDLPDFALENIVDTPLHEVVVNGGKWEFLVQAYLAQISFADALVGELLDAIESSPYAANTIIALWSDHGYHLGEKQSWHKSTLWEESTRVPFAIAAPGVTQSGRTIDEAVGLVDLYPTLAELAHLPPVPNIDGKSLASLVDGSEATLDRPAFVDHALGSVVRTTDWSYIQYADRSEELYDMQSDPGQTANLAGNELFSSVLQELRTELNNHLASRKIIVDSTLDTPDANPGDGVAEDASGNVTLRAAIEEANVLPGAQRIHFNIAGAGSHSIKLNSALPTITEPVHIDGTTQLGYAGIPTIELDGSHAGPAAHGLVITAGGSTVRGLSINRFASIGIVLEDGGGNTIAGNVIGVDVDSQHDAGNGQHGILLFNSANNTIGGAEPEDRNIVSGNEVYGIYVAGPDSTGNVVRNNFVGVSVDGLLTLGNGDMGVRIGDGASANRIAGNVISGNRSAGVGIDGQDTSQNVIAANAIGVDATTTRLRGNYGWGVVIQGASANRVGGVAEQDGNVIAGNGQGGVGISGVTARGNSIRHNSIYANGGLRHLGIDLDQNGRSPNDVIAGDEDQDGGPNKLQNAPALASAVLNANTLAIRYSVSSATIHSDYTPGGLTIDFYLADEANGEGKVFLGSDTYAPADATRLKVVTIDLQGVSIAAGDAIVATATDAAGNTSEFSLSVSATTTAGPLPLLGSSVLSTARHELEFPDLFNEEAVDEIMAAFYATDEKTVRYG